MDGTDSSLDPPPDGRDAPGLPHQVALGALAWALYAALHVTLNPVVIDETVVSAQILDGVVEYPTGHPHEVFHLQAFSLPNHLSAALLAATDSVEAVSRARNFLVVFLSAFAPFLVALLLTRRPLAGFAAAALALTDCVYRFDGVYPTFVFPTFYSHGHVGAYGAVVAVALLAGGFTRTGALLAGAFPSIHPLLGALVWLWCIPFVLGSARGRDPRPAPAFLSRFAPLFLVGLALGAGSFAYSRARAPDVEPVGLYAPEAATDPGVAAEAGEVVRRTFIELTDPHRRMPPADSPVFLFGYVANGSTFVMLAALLLVALPRACERLRRATLGVVALGLLAWAVVWGSRALELATGGMPDAIETAMPYRLSNISAILLVPLGVAALVRTARTRGATPAAALVLLGLLLAAGVASVGEVLRPEAYRRAFRLVGGIALLGAVIGAGLVLPGSATRRAASLAGGAVLAWVFLVQRAKSGFQGAELLGAAVVGSAALFGRYRGKGGDSSEPASPVLSGLAAAATVLCACSTLRSGNAEPSSLVSEFDEEVVAWLAEHAEPGEPILVPLMPRTQLQAKTGHPVLLELGTLWLMPYLPEVSAVIGRMTAELYGVDYADREQVERLAGGDGYLGQHDEAWVFAWGARTARDWTALAERWGFRIVVAPTDWETPLVPRLVGVEWTLYTVPGR